MIDDGTAVTILVAVVSAIVGVYFLAAAVQGWFYKNAAAWYTRVILFAAALLLMLSGWQTDLTAVALIILCLIIQIFKNKTPSQPQTHQGYAQ